MSCRESDSHMTEASRCGPHTASSECSCAYAPPSPFPNSPASRGQMGDPRGPLADPRCLLRPTSCVLTNNSPPVGMHARPMACMHACPPTARLPASRLASRPHSPSPLASPLAFLIDQTRGPRFTGPRFTGPRFTGPRFTQVAARTRRQLLPRRSRMHAFRRWRRAHHGAEPTTARSRPELLHQARRPPWRGAHHGALTTRAPASGGPAPAYASHSPRLQRRSSAHASRSPR